MNTAICRIQAQCELFDILTKIQCLNLICPSVNNLYIIHKNETKHEVKLQRDTEKQVL